MMARSLLTSVLLMSIASVIISSGRAAGASDTFFARALQTLPIDAGGDLTLVCGVERSAHHLWTYVEAYWLVELEDRTLVKLKPWDQSVTSKIPQYYIREEDIGGRYITILRLINVQNQHECLTFHCIVNGGYLHRVYTMQLKGNIRPSTDISLHTKGSCLFDKLLCQPNRQVHIHPSTFYNTRDF